MKWKEKIRVKIIKLILGSDFFQNNNLKKTQKHKNVFFGENLDFGEKSDFFINGDIVKLYIGNRVNCKRFCSFLLFPNASLIIY